MLKLNLNSTVLQYDYGNGQVTGPELLVGDKVVFRNATGKTYTMTAYKSGSKIVADIPNPLLDAPCPILVYIEGYPESRVTIIVEEAEWNKGFTQFFDNTKPIETAIDTNVTPARTLTIPIKNGKGEVDDLGLVLGEKHAVIVDGILYECVCKKVVSSANDIGFGNVKLRFSNQKDTGECFYVGENGNEKYIYVNNGASEVTIRIPEKIEPIDSRYFGGVALTYIKIPDRVYEGQTVTLSASVCDALDVAVGKPCILHLNRSGLPVSVVAMYEKTSSNGHKFMYSAGVVQIVVTNNDDGNGWQMTATTK